MKEQKLSLSPWLFYHGLLFSLLCYSGHAQPRPGSEANQHGLYTKFDPSMAIVIAVLVCAFLFAGLFSIIMRHCSDPSVSAPYSANPVPRATAAGDPAQQKHGLDPAAIDAFPLFAYSAVKDIKIGRETLECAVCLTEFEDDEKLRFLPKCSHVFHQECIDMWLECHVTCPVCRANLTPEDDEFSKELQQQTTITDSNHDHGVNDQTSEIITQEQVLLNVNEEQNRDGEAKNLPPRSGTSGNLLRSHSTGHSVVLWVDSIEKFTLRLPEEDRKEIISNAKLRRTMSFNVVLARQGSSRKGYRSGGEGSSRGKLCGRSDRWVLVKNPLFVPSGGWVKAWKVDNGGDSSKNSRTLLASVKMPLTCLLRKGNGVEDASGQIRPVV